MATQPNTIGGNSDGAAKGTDSSGTAQAVAIVGPQQDALKVTDTNSHLLSEILTELRITNQYLLCLVGEANKVTAADLTEES